MWPHDDTASKMAFYGDFRQKAWASINLVHIMPPFDMYYEKQPLPHGILVHNKIVPALQLVFGEIWDKCGHDQVQVDKTGASDYGGCFNVRQIAGSNSWSNHSWACALDFWPTRNGFNEPNPGFTEDSIVIKAFKQQGAGWGGNYLHRKDNMHVEFVSR